MPNISVCSYLCDIADMMEYPANPELLDELLALMPSGWTENKWAVTAGVNRSFFQDLRRGREPKGSTLEKLLGAIGMTPAMFHSRRELARKDTSPRFEVPNFDYRPMPSDLIGSMPFRQGAIFDLPTYGTAEGACEVLDAEGKLIEVDCMMMMQQEIAEYRMRPPGLQGHRNTYALRVVGDSMEPRYFHSELVYVDPVRPPSVMDFVIIQLRNGRQEEGVDQDPDQIVRILIKRLVRRGPGYMEFEQYNPAQIFRIETARIARIHRVMTMDEIG